MNYTSIFKKLLTLNIFLGLFLFFNYFFMSIIDVPWGDTLINTEEYLNTDKFTYIFNLYGGHLLIIPRLIDVFVLNFFNGSQTLRAYFYLLFYIINFLLFYKNLPKNEPNEKLLWALCLVIIFFSNFRLLNFVVAENGPHYLVLFFSQLSIYFYIKFSINKNLNLFLLSLIYTILAILTFSNGLVLLVIFPIILFKINNFFNTKFYNITLLIFLLLGVLLLIIISIFASPYNFAELLINLIGLPFTGIKNTYYIGLLLSLAIIIMFLDMLIKYFSYNIKFQNSQIFAFALVSFALISLFLVAFFRTYLYGDLYLTGHRYGIINLLIYLGLLIFYFDNFKKRIKPLNKIKLFFILYLVSLVWIYLNFVIGEFLIDRKNKFTKISSQILNNEVVDIDTFREINFYPNLEESKILYQKLWEANLFNLKKKIEN